MDFNAYILDWTINEYDGLLATLQEDGFSLQREDHKPHVRVAVPFSRVKEFAELIQSHLNAPFNYVDIQYLDLKKVVILFQGKTFIIESKEQNEEVKKWAINLGLPPKQADWTWRF